MEREKERYGDRSGETARGRESWKDRESVIKTKRER